MASPKEVVQWLPETLPEDFSEWDNEASPAAAPDHSGGSEAARAFNKPTKPGPAEREAILASVLERTRDPYSAPSVPDYFKPQKLSSAMVDRSPSRVSNMPEVDRAAKEGLIAPSRPSANSVEGMNGAVKHKSSMVDDPVAELFQSFSARSEDFGEEEPSKKKWMILGAVIACVALLLVVFVIPMFSHGTRSVAKQTVQPRAVAASSQISTSESTSDAKPSPRELLSQDKPSATTKVEPSTAGKSTMQEEGDPTQAQARADMMNDQLTAPTRIPQDIKKPVVDDAPPPSGVISAGLGGNSADDTVFKGQAQPLVKAGRPLVISAGVATGLLIQKTMPLYPPIAKAAKVTGTVVLQATISKEGTIKDLHVVEGPPMLRLPAVDAVRSWRYKPYKLNNDPIEVETTINVIFSLGA